MHFLALFITLAASHAAATPAVSSTARPTAWASSAIASAIRIARIFHPFARVIAFVAVQLPSAEDGLPRSRQRRWLWRFRGGHCPRWWRGHRPSWGLGTSVLRKRKQRARNSKE